MASNISLESKLNDVCRCCLREDGFQDISSENLDSVERETYEGMLKTTFNIQITHHNNVPKMLICERCIPRLQDASTFKQMVIQSEDTFIEYLRILQENEAMTTDPIEELQEPIKIEEPSDTVAFNIGCEAFTDSFDDDEILANIKLDLPKDETPQKPRKRKLSHDKKSKSKRCKIKEKVEIASNGSPEKDRSKIAERRGTGPLLRENSLKLLQNSTLCVFQWNKSRYRCFCCKEPFSDINLLRQHTFNNHTIENIERMMILQQNRLVKVEISSLNCKICRQKLDDLTMLRQHLSETHSMVIDEDLLVPFRIGSDFQCQICFEKFTAFRFLNIHINKHFQKQVCHICGAGFSNLVFLNLHRTRSHRPINCKDCNINFNNKTDKKHHDATIHNVKYERKLRFPCPYCPERFFQENHRVRHFVENHSMPKPDFKCDVCSKSFITVGRRNDHVKNVHNKEKNHECDLCHKMFYAKFDVARHRVTHTGEKKHCCGFCSTLFATRDSLRRHIKRTHSEAN